MFYFATLDLAGFWFDEIRTVQSIAGSLGEMLRDRLANGHPPVFFAIEWVIARAAGSGEFALRVPVALFALGGGALVYAIGSRLARPSAGLAAAALFLALPIEIELVHQARANTMTQFLSLLGTWVLVASKPGRERRDAVLFGAVSALNLYTNYAAILVVAAQVLFLLGCPRRQRVFAVAGVAALAAASPAFAGTLLATDVDSRIGWTAGLRPATSATFLGRAFAPAWTPNAHWIGMGAFAAGALALRGLRPPAGIVAAIWLLPPLLAAVTNPNVLSVSRYFAATWAAQAILIGATLGVGGRVSRAFGAAAFVAFFALAIDGTAGFIERGLGFSFREATRIVAEERAPDEAVILLASRNEHWTTFLHYQEGDVYDLANPLDPPRNRARPRTSGSSLNRSEQGLRAAALERMGGAVELDVSLPAGTRGVWIFMTQIPRAPVAAAAWRDLGSRFPLIETRKLRRGTLIHRWRTGDPDVSDDAS